MREQKFKIKDLHGKTIVATGTKRKEYLRDIEKIRLSDGENVVISSGNFYIDMPFDNLLDLLFDGKTELHNEQFDGFLEIE